MNSKKVCSLIFSIVICTTLFSSLLSSEKLFSHKIYKLGKNHSTMISIFGGISTAIGAYTSFNAFKKGDYKLLVPAVLGTATTLSCVVSPNFLDKCKNIFLGTKNKSNDSDSTTLINDSDNVDANVSKKDLTDEIEKNLKSSLNLSSLSQIMNPNEKYKKFVDFSTSTDNSPYPTSLSYFDLKKTNEELRDRSNLKSNNKQKKSITGSIGLAGICSPEFNILLNNITKISNNLLEQKNKNRIRKLPLIFSILPCKYFKQYTTNNPLVDVDNTTMRDAIRIGYQYLIPFIITERTQKGTYYRFDEDKLNTIKVNLPSPGSKNNKKIDKKEKQKETGHSNNTDIDLNHILFTYYAAATQLNKEYQQNNIKVNNKGTLHINYYPHQNTISEQCTHSAELLRIKNKCEEQGYKYLYRLTLKNNNSSLVHFVTNDHATWYQKNVSQQNQYFYTPIKTESIKNSANDYTWSIFENGAYKNCKIPFEDNNNKVTEEDDSEEEDDDVGTSPILPLASESNTQNHFTYHILNQIYKDGNNNFNNWGKDGSDNDDDQEDDDYNDDDESD